MGYTETTGVERMTAYGRSSPSLEVALTAILAAAYAIGTVALAPISFLAFQVRVTDALIPLAFYLKRPAVAGVTIGCLIANIFSPFGFMDIIIGTVANFLSAATLMYAPRWWLAWVTPCCIIPWFIGAELAFFLGPDLLLIFVFEVFVGTFISVAIIGTILLQVVMQTFKQFEDAFPKWSW
jgi:uncharacterized membrane protein